MRNCRDNRISKIPQYRLLQHSKESSGVLIRFRLYLQELTVLVFDRKSKTIVRDGRVFGIMVIHEYLVYEFPGGRIKSKYAQEQDRQYLM